MAYNTPAPYGNPLPAANGGTGAVLNYPLITNNNKISVRNSRFPFISRTGVRQVMASPPTVSWSTTAPTGTITSATISGTTLTVSTAGIFILPGMALSGTSVTSGTVIVAQLTGSAGGSGTYSLNLSSTVGSGTAMTATMQAYPSTDAGQGSSGGRPIANRFSYTKARNITVHGNTSPQYRFVKGTNVSIYNSGVLAPNANTLTASFTHTGYAVVILMGGYGGNVLIKVDDQYITLTPQQFPNNNNVYYGVILFSTYAKRRIDVLTSGDGFGGVMCGLNDVVVPSEVRGPSVFAVGDSFIGGASTSPFYSTQSWFQAAADYLGWDDAVSNGCGGSGFVADSSGSASGGKPYSQRLATDVIPFNPDIVIFQPSVNDTSQTASAVVAAATTCFQMMQTSCPNTIIICTSPMQSTGNSYIATGNNLLNQAAALKTLCASMGVIYLNLQTQPVPANYAFQTTTLTSPASANATTIFTSVALKAGGTYQFADNSQVNVLSASGGSSPFTNTVDRSPNAQSSAATITEIGSPILTGNGNTSAPTGYGTADVMIGNDGIHPTTVQCDADGESFANALLNVLYSN